jgi:hypothetical protein
LVLAGREFLGSLTSLARDVTGRIQFAEVRGISLVEIVDERVELFYSRHPFCQKCSEFGGCAGLRLRAGVLGGVGGLESS